MLLFLDIKSEYSLFCNLQRHKKNLYIVEKIKNISYLQSMLEYRNVSCAISNIWKKVRIFASKIKDQ